MPTTEDWAFEIRFRHTGDHDAGSAFLVKDEFGPDDRILLLRSTGTGTTDSWDIEVGNTDGDGWIDLATGIVLGDSFHTVTAHYKADTGTMNVFLDGVFLGEATTPPSYAVDFIQLQNIGGNGLLFFDRVVLGQVVPKPPIKTRNDLASAVPAGVDLAALHGWDIVVAADAIASEVYAVEDFRDHLVLAGGPELPIVKTSPHPKRHVFIGSGKAKRQSPVRFETDGFGPEDLRIIVRDGNIAIAGG